MSECGPLFYFRPAYGPSNPLPKISRNLIENTLDTALLAGYPVRLPVPSLHILPPNFFKYESKDYHTSLLHYVPLVGGFLPDLVLVALGGSGVGADDDILTRLWYVFYKYASLHGRSRNVCYRPKWVNMDK